MDVVDEVDVIDIINIDIDSVHVENGSRIDSNHTTIPKKLKSWYGHTSFRSIILSILSIMSILCAFIGLYTQLIEPCECIGFVSSIIFLFAPSPLTHK